MKKFLSIFLVLILCFSFCSCGNKTDNTDEKTNLEDTIHIDTLISDLENGAKAKLNEGKTTTVFGRIKNITSTYCTIELMKPKNYTINVSMKTETLAELESDDFIAISGEVESYSDAKRSYEIKCKKIEDATVMDDIFRNYIEEITSSSYWSGLTLVDTYSKSFLYSFVSHRESTFAMKDDEKLRNYLIGKWDHEKTLMGESTFIDSVEFKADGTYFWDKSSSWDQSGDWSIENGKLNSFMGSYPQTIFVLSDNIFICSGLLHIRITETDQT